MAGKVMERDKTGRTVQITNVRLSFGESLQEAAFPKKRLPDSRATHSANFILEKSHPDYESNRVACVAALEAAAREFGRKPEWWKTLWEDSWKEIALRKGDRFKDKDDNIYKGYEDTVVVVAKGPKGGMNRPKIIDRRKQDVPVEKINEVCYNGSYCDAIISWYGTDNGGTARLTCSVEFIRCREEGERLGGGGIYVDANDFDDIEDDNSFEDAPKITSGSALDM